MIIVAGISLQVIIDDKGFVERLSIMTNPSEIAEYSSYWNSIIADKLKHIFSTSEIPKTIPDDFNFNILFKYGVGARNVLDTYNQTYTKDMVVGSAITIEFKLSKEELFEIYKKMIEIDFFQYSDTFVVPIKGNITKSVTPNRSYYFQTNYNSKTLELYWNDKNLKADKLRQLIGLMINLIESKDKYKALPERRSAYL